jgi:hypothetical protein
MGYLPISHCDNVMYTNFPTYYYGIPTHEPLRCTYQVKLRIMIPVKQVTIYLRLFEYGSVTSFCIIGRGFLKVCTVYEVIFSSSCCSVWKFIINKIFSYVTCFMSLFINLTRQFTLLLVDYIGITW